MYEILSGMEQPNGNYIVNCFGGIEMKEYKVLTQKDNRFSGKFDPAALEAAINSYAQQGWVVKSAFSTQVPGYPGLGGTREEALVILERNVD